MTLYSLCLPDYMELAVSLLDLTGYCVSFRIPCLTALVPQILPGVPHSSPTQGWLGVESATVSLVPQSGGKACDFATRSMQVSPSVGATPQNALGQDSLRSWSLLFLPQRAHRFGVGGISVLEVEVGMRNFFPPVGCVLSHCSQAGLQSCSRMMERLAELSQEDFPLWSPGLSTQVGCAHRCPSSPNLNPHPWVMDTLNFLLLNSSQMVLGSSSK